MRNEVNHEGMVTLSKVSFSYMSRTETSACGGGRNHEEAVLRDFSLDIRRGETILLTGPSGCGKTTALRLINGLIPRYYHGALSGEIMLAGESIRVRKLSEISRLTGTVFQNPRSQFFNADVMSELAFASENAGMPPGEILARISRSAAKLGIQHLLNASLFKLSGGEKQKIAQAAVDVAGPGIILLDEPSANLDYEGAAALHDLIKIWQEEGKTIVISEHRLAYLGDLPDKTLVMSGGRIVRFFEKGELMKAAPGELAESGLRTNVPEDPRSINLPDIQEGDRFITLGNFGFQYRNGIFRMKKSRYFGYDGIRIALGRITAVTGASGSGKTTFLNCLAGLEKSCRGIAEFGGCRLTGRERRKHCFLVMQDVNHQLFSESAEEELRLSLIERGLSPADEESLIAAALKQLDLEDCRDAHPMSLSGGQKQRLAIACALCSGRDFLLFDEPTSGLDYQSMLRVSDLLKQLRDSGKTIVVVTHDSELIRCCCERRVEIGGMPEAAKR